MKRAIFLVLSAILLSGCGGDETVKTDYVSVPLFCDETKVLAAFPEKVPNPKYLPTDWEPAEDTDLYAAYKVGGIACSYGIGEAEIGATVIWAPDDGTLFNELSKGWVESGMKEIDLPGIDEEKAFVLTEGTEGEGEYHVWKINLLQDDYWIQVGATFFSSIDEAIPIVKAASESMLTPEEASAKNVIGCYFTNAETELSILNITNHEHTSVTAKLILKPFQKDMAKGTFSGIYENGILHGIYTFQSEGAESQRELFFKRNGGAFMPGYGPVEVIDNKLEKFQRPLQLKWSDNELFTLGEECTTVLKALE
ncbi:MAG: hypothetical protein EBY01_04800 [Actinobacteria bacterium]|jgi:hypothetical protein|nr:hypothetical protein [Actinomycetota bacterium]